MTEVVLRHPDLPGQPIFGVVGVDGTVTPNLADSGWVIDLDTEPSAARRERPEPRPEPAPVTPHFAEPPAEAPTAPAVDLKRPAEPAKPEPTRKDALNLEKE